MPSKMVTDRQKLAVQLIAAIRRDAPIIEKAMANTLLPFVEVGETLEPQAPRLLLLARGLEKVTDRMIETDEWHEAKRRWVRRLRRQRDDGAKELYRALVDVRDACRSFFGAEQATNFLGVGGRTHRRATALRLQAEWALNSLREPDWPMPKMKQVGVHGLREGWARKLVVPLKVVQQTADMVVVETRRAQLTLGEKRRALAAFNWTYGRMVRYFEALYHLVGEDELANSLRPPIYRPDRIRRRQAKQQAVATDTRIEEAAKKRSPSALAVRAALRWLGRRLGRPAPAKVSSAAGR